MRDRIWNVVRRRHVDARENSAVDSMAVMVSSQGAIRGLDFCRDLFTRALVIQ